MRVVAAGMVVATVALHAADCDDGVIRVETGVQVGAYGLVRTGGSYFTASNDLDEVGATSTLASMEMVALAVVPVLDEVSDGAVLSLLDEIRLADQHGHRVLALDTAFGRVDDWLDQERFARVDALLERLPVEDLSIAVVLSVLVVTFPKKDHLKRRASLLSRFRSVLTERETPVRRDALLTGLE